MSTVAITGGTVVDRNGSRRADVLVDDRTGSIVAVTDPAADGAASADAGSPDTVLDASGCIVAPGFVDLAVHVRQPGDEASETIDTAARAAALGGYTAVVALADTDPCADVAAVVAEIEALAKGACCDILPAGAVTVGRAGTTLAPYGELVEAGVRLLTDAPAPIDDPGLLRRALEYLDGINEMLGVRALIACRPELAKLGDDGVMNEGAWSSRLGLPGRPAAAEELGVARELAVGRLAGTAIHLQQISTAGSVALIRAAKADGQVVTADVAPHHLVLDESACETFDPNTKVRPPLRTSSDRAALVAGLLDGTIDAIATDHQPWVVDAKERPFDQAPDGVVGLETAVAVLLTDLDVGIEELLPALSWQPAAIAGVADRHGGPIEPDRPANLTVVDPDARWTVDAPRGASRSANTPFDGRELTGRIRHTILAGSPTVTDGSPTR